MVDFGWRLYHLVDDLISWLETWSGQCAPGQDTTELCRCGVAACVCAHRGRATPSCWGRGSSWRGGQHAPPRLPEASARTAASGQRARLQGEGWEGVGGGGRGQEGWKGAGGSGKQQEGGRGKGDTLTKINCELEVSKCTTGKNRLHCTECITEWSRITTQWDVV